MILCCQDYPVSSLNPSRNQTQLGMLSEKGSEPPSAIGIRKKSHTTVAAPSSSQIAAENAITQQLKELQDQYTLL